MCPCRSRHRRYRPGTIAYEHPSACTQDLGNAPCRPRSSALRLWRRYRCCLYVSTHLQTFPRRDLQKNVSFIINFGVNHAWCFTRLTKIKLLLNGPKCLTYESCQLQRWESGKWARRTVSLCLWDQSSAGTNRIALCPFGNGLPSIPTFRTKPFFLLITRQPAQLLSQ